MKAIVYNGPRDVEVKEMPDPSIQHPSDVIVKVTTANICGSDLHMYEGRTNLEPGKIIGREILGEILECGPAVASLKRGDQVCIPFNCLKLPEDALDRQDDYVMGAVTATPRKFTARSSRS